MKHFKIAALGATALYASIVPAFADPISVGSFVISAFLSVGLGGVLPTVSAAVIGQFVIGAAVLGASVLSSVIGARRPDINPGDFKNTFETGDSSEIRAIGRVRVSGLKAFGNTTGVDRYRLICHTKGLWSATEEHFLGGREVTIDSDGAVSSPPYSKPGGSYVYVQSKVGDGTETAWSDLVTAFPSLWTTNHRVRGIHQSLVKYISPGIAEPKFLKLYQQGEPPYEKVGRAEPIYDPRDVGQSATNSSTWEWDDNGILCAAHILRTYPSLAATDLDYVDIALEATKAEVLVDTLTGTEERSRASGLWTSESPRGDVMEQVLRSIGAEIVPMDDNTYTIRLIDDTRTAEIEFTDKHLIDVSVRYGPESVERPNVCRVRYYAPERNYEMTEIDLTGIAWARIDDEVDNVGEQIFDVELPFCFSASQAQRIARRLFALARSDAGVAKFNFAGMAAWGLTTASIPFPDIGTGYGTLNRICAISTPRVNDVDGTVEIPFIVWPDLTEWNPAVDEAAAPEKIPDLLFESELDTPAAPTEALIVRYPNGNREVRVKFAGVAGGTIAEANYRTYTGGLPNAWQSMTEYEGVSGAWYGWASFGTNMLVNGAFDTDTIWTKGTGYSISGGKAVGVAGAASALSQTLSLTVGREYHTELTMVDRTAGTLRQRLQGGTNVNGSLLSADGRYSEDLVAVTGNNAFGIVKSSDFAGKVDDVCVYDKTAGWIGDGTEADFRSRFFNAEEEGSYFSDIFNVASMAVNNTTPGAPTASGVNVDTGSYAIEVTARAPEMRVVKMVVEEQYTEPSIGFAWRTLATWNDVRPDENRTVTTTAVYAGPYDATLQWRVSSYTSDGTQGPYASGSRTITGTGGP